MKISEIHTRIVGRSVKSLCEVVEMDQVIQEFREVSIF